MIRLLKSRSEFSVWRHIAAGMAACIAAAPAITYAATIRSVAITGRPAPGMPSGVNYNSFDFPVLNDAGQTAFRGFLVGTGVNNSNNQGIWSEGPGSMTLIARGGTAAPGATSGVNFSGFDHRSLVLNDAGQTAFLATLTGNGVNETNNQGIWSQSSGSLALAVRSGSHAPGTPSSVEFSDFGLFSDVLTVNDMNQIAFLGTLTGAGVDSTNNRGIWSYDSGSLALVARSGNEVPGMPGVNFGFFNPPVLNNAGQIAFHSRLAGSGVNSGNDRAIWLRDTGSLELVVRTGSQAPDIPSGATFSGFGVPALNDAGQTAFSAGLTGGVDPENDGGVWSEGSGNLALVVLAGAQPPGAPSGARFGGFSELVLNDAGKLAFRASVFGGGVEASGAEGIWSDVSGSLEAVAFAETQAAAMPSGVMFRGFDAPAMNDAGQIAFRASVFGSGVDSTNSGGIWATNRTSDLQLIVRTGDVLEVAPGDFRTIRSLTLVADTGNSDGRPSGFNNLGQLAFWAQFTDNSQGIFISNLVAIPEPNSLFLVALATAAVFLASSRPSTTRSHARAR